MRGEAWRLLGEAAGEGPRPTRRAVLAALAAAAAAPAPPAPIREGRVLIVGGGIAGLSALWHLTQAGVDAYLFEARPRLGGRMLTLRGGPMPWEMGGQLVNSDHADIRALSRACGIALIDRKAAPHRMLIVADGRAVPEAKAVAALRPIAARIAADAARLDAYPVRAAALDQLSFTSYLDRHADALPAPWVRALIEGTARTEYGVEPHEASAIELIWNLPAVTDGRVDMLAASDERWLIAGGSGALVDALAARLRRRITTGHAVVAVERAGAGVRLRFADGAHADGAAAIVATPAGVTRRIAFPSLPPLWRAFHAEVELGRNEKVLATMATRPWQRALGRGGELWHADAGPVALGWEGSVRPGPADGGTWCWFLGGDQVAAATGDPAALAGAYAERSTIPGMAAASALRTAWHRDRWTGGAYVNFRPGQVTRFAPLLWAEGRPPLSAGLVHFAGEHLSDAYPGYMNGAAQTGRLAAAAVMAGMGIRRAA